MRIIDALRWKHRGAFGLIAASLTFFTGGRAVAAIGIGETVGKHLKSGWTLAEKAARIDTVLLVCGSTVG